MRRPSLFLTFFGRIRKCRALKKQALDLAKGSVLDIGAGAGSHSLFLQDRGLEVTALDPSPDAITCCEKRGITKTHCTTIQEFKDNSYDTLLMLMNGIGLAGSLGELEDVLHHLKSLLRPGGQILLDSSDIRYMFELDEKGNPIVLENETYYGDIQFAVYYDGEYEMPFPWVYVDYDSLSQIADNAGLKAEKIMDGPHFDYLARLTLA